MTETPALRLRERCSAANLFSAGLFCLVLGMFFGAKLIAAGQVIILCSLVAVLFEKGRSVPQWRELGSSARWLAFYLLVSVVSILANFQEIEAPLTQLGKLRYHVIVLLVLMMPALVRDHLEVKWRRDCLVLAWLVPLVLAVLIGMVASVTGEHPLRGHEPVNLRRISGFYGQVMTFANSLQFSVVALAVFF